MQPLPVDDQLPAILAGLGRSPNLVLRAPPGAGKTTRVPPALLELAPGQVLVLEPRRIAARAAAHRVATERGERPGETVGYQVRFEECGGPSTRLRFLTEGILTRRLLSDPALRGVDTVVLDEFHERHLESDLALALLKRLQRTTRPDLRLVVMSATVDTAPLARFLGECPVMTCEGRLFDVSVTHTPHSALPLEEQVDEALRRLIEEGLDGDVLVFLPGAREIRRALRCTEALARRAGLLPMPLHGDLDLEDQVRVLEPAPQPKLILSTNVAESSITIDGVTAVIDSGLARVASTSPWSGLPALNVTRVSRSSAIQRAGRAGRTRPGRVIRLYTAEDFARRPEHDPPEISRLDLTSLCLQAHALAAGGADALEWLTPPPEAAMQAAVELLARLGAIHPAGRLTPLGRRMAGYPLHPRLARLVLEGDARGAGEEACAAAALLDSGERIDEDRPASGPSDLLHLLERAPRPALKRHIQQIRRVARPRRGTGGDEALLISVLAAFPDRVARRRQGRELLLAGGGGAVLDEASVVRDAGFLVAVDVEERREHGLPLVRLASAIRPEWLLDLFPDRISEESTVEWNRAAARVDATSSLLYGRLVIEESRGGPPDPVRAAALLAERAWEAGLGRFADPDEIEQFLARVVFASAHSALRPLSTGDVRAALESLCQGLRSFTELEQAARGGALLRALQARLPADAARLLDEVAPSRIRLPGGRSVRIHYSPHQPPWAASRLQDFFGLTQTPSVARGAVPVVLQLLAPNQRPVQTTTDLAGFWQRLYPQVRRELCRRYPKHAWPENPLAAGGSVRPAK